MSASPRGNVAHDEVAEAVLCGLTAPRKSLPPFLFYDARGSALFEDITELPEYYLTRTERGILVDDADRIVAAILRSARGPVAVLELGAGTATKTDILLQAFARACKDVHYFPADVSPTPLDVARARIASTLPQIRVSPIVGTHDDALQRMRAWEGELAVFFLGSSIGNYADDDAVALIAEVRGAIGRHGSLLLGADRTKPLDVLLPAYDDPAGVTAAFNRNVLARINRELGGDFDPASFRHVAIWNEETSAIEMHLESVVAQRAHVAALGLTVDFARGERIHTESSHKYTERHMAQLLEAAGLRSESSFEDARRWFSLHLARALSA